MTHPLILRGSFERSFSLGSSPPRYQTDTVVFSESLFTDACQLQKLTCTVCTVIDHPRGGVVYNFVLSLCLSVCMHICQTITFESVDEGSSFLHIQYITRKYRSSLYIKVIGLSSRSQEPKRYKSPIPAM